MSFIKSVFFVIMLFAISSAKALVVGDKAPDFKLKDQKESFITLSEQLKDKIVLIHFWSPSNIKSREKHSYFSKIANDYKNTPLGKANGLVVVSVCLEQLKESWEMAVAKDGCGNLINVWDKNGLYSLIAKSYQLTKLPTDFLVNTNGKILLIDPNDVSLHTRLIVLNKNASVQTDISAKLLYGTPKNLHPLAHQKVYLVLDKDTLNVAETDDYGDFVFKQVMTQGTELSIGKTNEIKETDNLYLAKQNGVIVNKFTKSASGFNYKMLDKDVARLSEIVEEDSGLKLDAFNKSSNKELLLVENIYYATDDYKVSDKTAKLLTKIAETMKTNTTLKLEVSSHTDAKGADAYNKELSDKRAKAVMEFLVSKGIAKTRIKAIGMGETKVLNRCKNDVNCSEKEHELNRRTEFKFSK
ncbi:MAG: OmpA family protein [Bacteroidetes bacterium]|nr:OmpA family protein [Bacteroidota bacterium]